uniref:NADH dehydrogenase subunit 6 n=1 Tax=Thetys vagina TaxID=942565 RepID=A0AA86M995_9UROC|nr:NADH dehydrogenase subunit 6 [Thetys vagina]
MSLFLIFGFLIPLLGGEFLSLVMAYFIMSLNLFFMGIHGNGGLTPFLLLLLFTGGMMVFVLFSTLIFSSKLQTEPMFLLVPFIFPSLLGLMFQPLYLVNLSGIYTLFPFSMVILPSLGLYLMSVMNLRVIFFG